jgi:hypothetical protein
VRSARAAAGVAALLAALSGEAGAEHEAARAFLVEQHGPEIARSFTPLARQLAAAEAPPGAPPDWAERVERAFAGDALFEEALRHAAARFDPARAESFARFHATPLGTRVRAAEAEVLRTDRAALDAFLAAQPQEPVTDERAALVRRLDRAQGSSELYVQATRSIRTGLQRASGTSTPAESAEDDALLAILSDAADRSLRVRLRAASESTALFTFRQFSSAELAEYAAFCESPDAQWGFRTLNDALLAAAKHAAESLAGAAPAP